MPERFKEAFNVQMAMPVWSVVSALVMGIFAAGAIYQKLNTLADNYGKTADRVSAISDRQIRTEGDVATLQRQAQTDSDRITVLERSAWEKAR